jgi:hypothetical protein
MKSSPFLSLLISAGLALLVYNAATTMVWDDESNGFFLALEPLPELLALMAANVHEDPPLFDLILHAWHKVAGYDPLALRLLSVCFWLLTLLGLRQAGDRLGGPGTGLLCVAVAVWMPYHWMFPAALRWFSLFACLAVWNFLALLSLLTPAPGGQRPRNLLPSLAGYILSGAALWYTNYAAPAVFLAHGVAALATPSRSLRSLIQLGLGWAGIGLLYLPWLPVFIRQLGHSAAPFSAKATAASIYALWAGEVSTPLAWWISVPLGIAAATACVLILLRWRHTALPALVGGVLVAVLVAKNVIWTKRLLILSPFLALAIGLAIRSVPATRVLLWAQLRRVFLVASALAICGGLVNVFRREGWMTYRWLVPVGEVVQQSLQAGSGHVLLTNSNVAAFYARDPVGLNMASRKPEKVPQMTVLPCYPTISETAQEVIRQRLAQAGTADYIHDSSSVRFTDISAWLTATMAAHGFKLSGIDHHAEASAEYLRFHPGGGKNMSLDDRSRLLVVHFKRQTKP